MISDSEIKWLFNVPEISGVHTISQPLSCCDMCDMCDIIMVVVTL